LQGNGLVSDVFKQEKDVQRLVGRYGIGHVRYPTAGSSSDSESQPFYTNSPLGISLGHNGNLTNTEALRVWCRTEAHRQVNTESDSELILIVFSHFLDVNKPSPQNVFDAVEKCMEMCQGAFAIVMSICNVGIVGFRDPHGIRPMCVGERHDGAMVTSESVAIEVAGFRFTRDVAPGEAVLLSVNGGTIAWHQCVTPVTMSPCIFEYVYFARPDSVIDGASVYEARMHMGDRLARRIQALHPTSKVDIVVPVPSTSRVSAVQCAITLGVPYVEGLTRNRYTGRTFIMPGQKKRVNSVRMKLNPVSAVIRGKAVLLVDDSIVRGTTSRHIVEIMRAAGATAVYFASAAPAIRYPNVYGIDMPTSTELIAYNRDELDVAEAIGADWVVYQSIPDLVAAVRTVNPALRAFDMSCFDGVYCAGPLPVGYFEKLRAERGEGAVAVNGGVSSKTLVPHASQSTPTKVTRAGAGAPTPEPPVRPGTASPGFAM